MSAQEPLRLAHAYREGALDNAEAVLLAGAVARDPETRRAIALDGQLALALGDDRAADDALLTHLRAQWPVRSAGSARHHRTQRTASIRRRTPSSNAWIAAAGMLAALVVAGLWSAASGSHRPADDSTLVAAPLTAGRAVATLARRGTPLALASSQALVAGDRISVPDGATITINGRREASDIQLTGPAELTVVADAPGKHLVLHRGRLFASVAPQPASHPLVVSCPFSEITVVGTSFSIAADPAGDRIEVQHGTVRVGAAGGGPALLLGAGQAAEAGAGKPLALVAPKPTPPAVPLAATAASVPGAASAWFDFNQASGASVANRADPSRPGTLIDALLAPGGRTGQALRLTTGNSRFLFPAGASQTMTVALWIRRDSQAKRNDNPALLALPRLLLYTHLGREGDPQPTDDALHLITRSGTPIAGWSTNGRVVRYGAWQHVVLTISDTPGHGATPELWLDGINQQLWPWTGDWPQASADPVMGTVGIEPGVQHSVAGLVDDLRVWPRVLTAGEIEALTRER